MILKELCVFNVSKWHVCAHAHKIHSAFYRLSKRHMSEVTRDAAVERTRHPAQEKIMTVALTIFYRFHLY